MNYTIYWLDGKFEKVSGSSISDAFTKAGLGAGAIRAMDFYEEGHILNYQWNPKTKEWERKV